MFYQEVLKPLLESIANYGTHNAFYISERFYTYHELADTISKVRNALKEKTVTGKNIGLIANDDLETYASIFAIWLEGAAYVPLNPQQPVARSLEIIYQAEISSLLDSSKKFKFESVETILIKDSILEPVNILPPKVSDNALAYIIFTSGSTGKPKGVQISRKNVAAFVKSFWKTGIEINEKDRCLQCFDLTFDVSVQSFLVPLLKGACTYTIPHDQIKYSYVYGLLEDHQLTFGAMVPSLIRYLRPYFNEIYSSSIRFNIMTAESSPIDLVKEWSKCIPDAKIFNFYGPTEATIYCTFHEFHREGENKQLNGMMSIGKAMPGLNAIIVSEEGEVLGPNQKGELCISGDQITPGYWKNPEKNKESFFEIEFKGKRTRFYKTGDSCYFDDDGDIMLAGRLDQQVKIQGYRIELGEIEYHAREFLQGQNAIACAFTNAMGNNEIALFVEGTLTDEARLLAYLGGKMPVYMLPSRIITENDFPLNKSGKVDRISLKNQLK